MKKCLVKYMQTYPPHTKNSLEACLPAVPIGISSKGKREKYSQFCYTTCLKNVYCSNMTIRKQSDHSTNLPFAYVVILPMSNNRWAQNTAPSWIHRLPTSGLFRVKCHTYCSVYIFLHLLTCAKSVLFLSCSFSCATDKGFECCAPNPNLPINSVVFTELLCRVWWLLGTRVSHSSTAACIRSLIHSNAGAPTLLRDTLLCLARVAEQDVMKLGPLGHRCHRPSSCSDIIRLRE